MFRWIKRLSKNKLDFASSDHMHNIMFSFLQFNFFYIVQVSKEFIHSLFHLVSNRFVLSWNFIFYFFSFLKFSWIQLLRKLTQFKWSRIYFFFIRFFFFKRFSLFSLFHFIQFWIRYAVDGAKWNNRPIKALERETYKIWPWGKSY